MRHGNDKTPHSPEALTCLSAFVLCSHESTTDHTCHSTLVSASLFKQRCFTGGPRLWFLQPSTFILHIPIKFICFPCFLFSVPRLWRLLQWSWWLQRAIFLVSFVHQFSLEPQKGQRGRYLLFFRRLQLSVWTTDLLIWKTIKKKGDGGCSSVKLSSV